MALCKEGTTRLKLSPVMWGVYFRWSVSHALYRLACKLLALFVLASPLREQGTTTQPPSTPWPDPYHYQRVWYQGGCGPVSLVHSLGPLCNTFCTRRTPHVPSVRPLPPEPSRLTHLRCFRSETLYHPVRTTGQQSLCPHATPQGPGLGPVLQPPRSHGAHCQCY
jgi:hypothetical protein